MAESKEELMSHLMKVKKECEIADLKLSIQKTKNMASCLIISWQINGEEKERVTDFIFLGSKITADDDCSHEVKRCFLPGRKVMTNLDSILKSRDMTLSTKVSLVKVIYLFIYLFIYFHIVIHDYESWTIKQAWAKELMLLNCGVGEDS